MPLVENTNDDINDTIDYWTPERMRNAKYSTSDDNKDGFPAENTSNFTSVDDVIEVPSAVGKYFFHDPTTNRDFSCTASVINTDYGNIGLTAGHCLYKYKDIRFTNTAFCPGFSNGQCAFGLVPVSDIALFITNGNYYYDYGLIKFVYNGKLQDKTGSFDWDANPGNEVDVTVLGYPVDGQFPCARNGNVLCMWQGHSSRQGSFRYVPIGVGHGSSGGPWIRQYDAKTKKGWIVGNSSASGSSSANSPIYAYNDFIKLIQQLSGK